LPSFLPRSRGRGPRSGGGGAESAAALFPSLPKNIPPPWPGLTRPSNFSSALFSSPRESSRGLAEGSRAIARSPFPLRTSPYPVWGFPLRFVFFSVSRPRFRIRH
jgi:hypothetical protein